MQKGKFKHVLLYLCLTLVISLQFGAPVEAATSITEGAGIYSSGNTSTEEYQENESTPNIVERYFAEFVRGIADSIQKILKECNATLDSIVYGRVGYATVNYFSFELATDNPYGVAGAAFYNILRAIALPITVAVLALKFAEASFGTSSQARGNFKKNLVSYGTAVIMIFAAPLVVDMMVFVRDIVLHALQTGMRGDSIFGGGTGIIATYQTQADESKRITDAIMYLAAVGVTFYFMFIYVGTGVATMLGFGMFPFVACMGMNDSKLINNWAKQMFGNIITPAMDAIILFIPVVANKVGAPDIIVFAMTMMLLPARGSVRSLLGLGGGRSELLGVGAMLATGKMIGNTMTRGKNMARNAKGSIESYNSDRSNQKMHEELANTEGAEISNPGIGAKAGSVNTARAEVMKKYANKNNFEDKQFDGVLSDSEKAQFYKERKVSNMSKDVAGGVAGTVGAVHGGLAGAGLGGMYGVAGVSSGVDTLSQVYGEGSKNIGRATGAFVGRAINDEPVKDEIPNSNPDQLSAGQPTQPTQPLAQLNTTKDPVQTQSEQTVVDNVNVGTQEQVKNVVTGNKVIDDISQLPIEKKRELFNTTSTQEIQQQVDIKMKETGTVTKEQEIKIHGDVRSSNFVNKLSDVMPMTDADQIKIQNDVRNASMRVEQDILAQNQVRSNSVQVRDGQIGG